MFVELSMTEESVPHFVFPWSFVSPSTGLQTYQFPYLSSTGRHQIVKTIELVFHKTNPMSATEIYKALLSL